MMISMDMGNSIAGHMFLSRNSNVQTTNFDIRNTHSTQTMFNISKQD